MVNKLSRTAREDVNKLRLALAAVDKCKFVGFLSTCSCAGWTCPQRGVIWRWSILVDNRYRPEGQQMLAADHAYLTCAQLVTRRQAAWRALGIKRAAWAAVRCCHGAGSPVCGSLTSSFAHVTDAQRRMRLAVKTASEKAGLDSLSSVRTHGSQSLRHRPAGPADVAKAQLVVVRCVAGSGRLAQLGLAAELRGPCAVS